MDATITSLSQTKEGSNFEADVSCLISRNLFILTSLERDAN